MPLVMNSHWYSNIQLKTFPNYKTSDTKQKRKQKKIVSVGIANIKSTFNNTIITVSDILGNTVCWASSGTSGFKGARKSTPFAAQTAARNAAL